MRATVDPNDAAVAGQPAAPAASVQPDPPRGAIAEWTITILLLLFGTTTLVQAFVIPTGSMENTLLIGDHLLVDKLAYAPPGPISKFVLPYKDPQHGDIIVFRYPIDINQTFVKRAIGIPGDHIRIVNQQVYRNGVRLVEPYVIHKSSYDSYRDNFPSVDMNGAMPSSLNDPLRAMLQDHVVNGEIVVPKDSFFAMGDNRDNSLDSRYWGFVPRENIIGKPLIIYWSYDASTNSLASSSPGDLARHFGDLAQHFFTKTRWNRTFRLIHGYHSNN